MGTTQISVCNEALALIAKGEINSLEETSLEARECKRFLVPLLEEMSEWADWPELVARVTLAQTTNDRPYEWLYAYAQPSDMAKPIAVRRGEDAEPENLPVHALPYTLPMQDADPLRFICEGGKVYTNVETAVLVYARSTLAVEDLTATMRRALVDELASRLVGPLNKDAKAKRVLAETAEISRARAISQAMNRTQEIMPNYVSEAELARAGFVR